MSSNQYHLASLAPSGEEGKALTALNAQKEALQATLPENWHLDFTWLLSWSAEQVNTLLGFCAAHGINGIQERMYNHTQKEEDGAATARNNLSQTWDYPSLVAALPYRYYDDRNEIFVNAGSRPSSFAPSPIQRLCRLPRK